MKFLDDAFDKFMKLLQERIKIYGERFTVLSQEALMAFLFGYSIVDANEDLLNKVFVEYPIEMNSGSRDKIDIYIDVHSGYYVEIKYVRPIPSGMNRPLPQHRGKLIDDVSKLCILTPPEAHKYLLLITDEEFMRHLYNKPGFIFKGVSWKGSIGDLVVNKTERQQIRNFEVIKGREIELIIKRFSKANTLTVVLWKISSF